MGIMKIGDYSIGLEDYPVVIAEMSANHNNSLDHALNIVEAASEAGVHMLKLQTYTADTMTLDLQSDEFFINEASSLWKDQSLFELYRAAHTPWQWHAPIMERASDLGLLCFSTPFDVTSVEFLEDLDVPAYKISSFESRDLNLIRKVAATGKPLIISTGLATIAEIDETVRVVRDVGCNDLILLKCTSAYPADPKDSNVRTIPHMRQMFNCEVGLSDHTPGIGAALAAVAFGATVIEKHFTLSRSNRGADSAFSIEPDEMKTLVAESRRVWESLGEIEYGPTPSEIESHQYRRSLYIVQDMKAGERLTPENLRSIRPGYGLSPKYYEIVLGRKITRDALKGTALNWDLV